MKVNSNMAILFWPYKQKADTQGNAPIYCRITIDSKRTLFSTGIKIDPKLWSKTAGKASGNSHEAQHLNEDLDTIKGGLRKAFNQLQASNDFVTGEMVRNLFTGKDQDKKTILAAFDFFIGLLKLRVDKKLTTKRHLLRFQCIKRYVSSYFQKEFRQSDRYLFEIKPIFGDEFFHYLILHQNMGENTAMNYVKKTRQVLTLAVRKEWIEKNPLADFRCTYRDPNRSYLSLAEVHDLSNAEMPSKRLDEVRDVYLFSCYTGYAYKELKNLSPQNIIIGIDGKKWLTIERSKTEGMETLPLLPVPLYLLEKYKDHPYCQVNNVILPVKSNQKYNEYIKEVAKAAGIKKSLTSHTARHTFATTMTLEHDVPLETVSKILGLRSLKTTQIYAKITTRKLSNNMKELENKLHPGLPLQAQTGS